MNNNIDIDFNNNNSIDIDFLSKKENIDLEFSDECVKSYPALADKPSINGEVLLGNKTSKDIHVQHEMDEITYQEIDNIIFG